MKKMLCLVSICALLLLGGFTFALQAPSSASAASATATTKGVNGNPWGYDFKPGKTITAPPKDFCGRYFHCIPNFSKGKGYVVQCHDNQYSKAGGTKGVCSGHKGQYHILYRH